MLPGARSIASKSRFIPILLPRWGLRGPTSGRDPSGSLVLTFESLSREQRAVLDTILASLPPVSVFDGGDERIVPAEIQPHG